MNVERAKYQQSVFGPAWNSKDDMDAADGTELKEMHNLVMSTHLQTKSIQFINLIRECCMHAVKDHTLDLEVLRTIVCKSEYNNLS